MTNEIDQFILFDVLVVTAVVVLAVAFCCFPIIITIGFDDDDDDDDDDGLISSLDHCQGSSPFKSPTRREQDLNLRRT